MPSRLRFVTQDVFTDRPFTGNRLAVLPDAREGAGAALPTAVLQAIAREFGFSETAFVLPARRDDCVRRVRIFTPETELPFAGHPTIGTALALVDAGIVSMPGDEIAFRLDLDAGPTAVRVVRVAGSLEAELTAPRLPQAGMVTAAEPVAAALRLPLAALDLGAHPPIDVGSGLDFLAVRLVDLAALAAAAPDRASLRALPSPGAGHGALCYVPMQPAAERLRMRVFVPEMGIDEDPATGSAAAGLAGFLAGLPPVVEGRREFTLEQGVEMGRPSLIRASVDVAAGAVTAVRIAGGAVTVTDGWLHLPH